MKPDNAEKIIRDYWGDGNVKDFATAITDVIIESPEKGMSFAAKVMPMKSRCTAIKESSVRQCG